MRRVRRKIRPANFEVENCQINNVDIGQNYDQLRMALWPLNRKQNKFPLFRDVKFGKLRLGEEGDNAFFGYPFNTSSLPSDKWSLWYRRSYHDGGPQIIFHNVSIFG